MQAVIADFGLLRHDKDADVRPDEMVPADAAPEVISVPGRHSFATDVFSFGLFMFGVFTSFQSDCFPWNVEGLSPEDYCTRLYEAASAGYADLVDQVPASVPKAAVDLMAACLAYDPEKRPTAGAIVQQMTAIVKQAGMPRI